MSIPVPVEGLADAMSGRAFAYLLTVGDDGRPHAVAVTPQLSGTELIAEVGRRTADNAAARPGAVSLVWPPAEVGGYSLIVDGVASVSGSSVHVRASKGVLHRPAPVGAGPAEPGSCGNDCVGVPIP